MKGRSMKRSFTTIAAVAMLFGLWACGGASGSQPVTTIYTAGPGATPSPSAKTLYVDHHGTLYRYALPLHAGEQPLQMLVEAPGSANTPQLSVDPFGTIAVATTSTVRLFGRPIQSLEPEHAKLTLKLTPAITEMGPGGADLVDIEFDPNNNLWLFNDLGGEISEVAAPIQKNSVAAVSIPFGAPGTKAAGYTGLIQGRFDVSAALYVYANQAATNRSRLFKISFPYSKPPSPVGLDIAQADFVDSSQYLPTDPHPNSLLLGQYNGLLSSPPPNQPPPPPSNVLAQFSEPFPPAQDLFPNAHADTIVGALIADPPREVFYTLDGATGSLAAYALPLQNAAKPEFTIPCPGVPSDCSEQSEHLYLSP
jgi:hypothetical protein